MGTQIINTEDKPAIFRDDISEKTHKGEMFFVSKIWEDVPSGGTVYFRHKGTGKKFLHSIIDVNSTGEWELASYEDSTYTADGTELTPINRLSTSDKTITTKFYADPTIDNIGAKRLDILFGSGTNRARVSTGSYSDTIRSIFGKDADVLVALTNRTNRSQNLTLQLNAFEEVELW